MKREIVKDGKQPLGGTFFSPRYFVLRAVALAALFLIAHLAGLREYTSFISGTTVSPGVSLAHSAFLGLIYLGLYMGCVVAAPILLLAAGLLAWWERSRGKARLPDPKPAQ